MSFEAVLTRLFGEPEPCRGRWGESYERGNCEPGATVGWPAQPLNTVSNGLYGIFGGVLIVGPGLPTAVVIGIAMIVLMIGSALYHGWPTDGTATLDHLGMHLVFASIFGASTGMPWPWVAAGTVVAGAVGVWRKPDVIMSMVVLLGATWFVMADPGWVFAGWLSAVLFLPAFLVWALDRQEYLGGYGHMGWHILTAGAIYCLAVAALPLT